MGVREWSGLLGADFLETIFSMASEALPSRDVTNDGPPPVVGLGRVIPNSQMIFWSCLVGFVGGLMAIVYYFLLKGAIWLVWTKLAHHDWLNLPTMPGFYPWVLGITTVGGFGVGLVLK